MKKFLIIYFLLTIWNRPLFSQTTSFTYYGVEQGLSQSQVQTIDQDNDGNLWIGTLSGLTKFNGKDFTVYSKNDGLAEDWITSSYKDKEGNIWFGHWAGGVSRYMYQTKTIENLELEEYTRFRKITCIKQDSLNRLWIATEGSGVFIFDMELNQLFSISKKNGFRTNNFYAISQDNKNNMWLASDSGIVVYDSNTSIDSEGAFTVIDKKKGLASNHITTLTFLNNSEMWIGTADSGVVVLNIPDNLTLKTSTNPLSRPVRINKQNGLSSNFIEDIYEDSKKNIWIATTGGGVVKCIAFDSDNRDEAISKALLFTYSTRQGLNYFNATRVLEDREKNIWIGTDMGLNQYRGERFQLYNISDSIISNLIWAMACDGDGNIWMGTNEGISKLTFHPSSVNGQLKHYVKNYTHKEGLPSNVILAIHEDAYGNMWFGTGYSGAYRLKKGSHKFEIFNAENGLANTVYSISSDNKGNVWLGTKEGASRYNPVTGEFKNYTLNDSLGGNNIYRIFKDSKGRMWFGALGGDLSVFDGVKFKKFRAKDGLKHRFILSITEDKNGNMWFGSYGGGLYKYDGKKFTNYAVKEGISTDSPYSIIADEQNNLWIGTSFGAEKFNPSTNSFIHYSRTNGFPGIECNPNAICRDKQGNIWFGTVSGAVKYNPSEDLKNTVEPKVFLTGLKIFMKDAPFPEDGKFLFDENHLTFSFVGVSLSSPSKVLYEYKLEGFDKDWVPDYTSNNEVVYSNLRPGKYTLLVKACNNYGVWNKEPLRYKFTIAPPFSQTAIFYILMALFIGFCLYGADKVRRKNLTSLKQQLEEKVKNLTVQNTELKRKVESFKKNDNMPENNEQLS